jgi:hypothetical protein
MACPELIRNVGLGGQFEDHRFFMLHPDGRRLIAHWFQRACVIAPAIPPRVLSLLSSAGLLLTDGRLAALN